MSLDSKLYPTGIRTGKFFKYPLRFRFTDETVSWLIGLKIGTTRGYIKYLPFPNDTYYTALGSGHVLPWFRPQHAHGIYVEEVPDTEIRFDSFQGIRDVYQYKGPYPKKMHKALARVFKPLTINWETPQCISVGNPYYGNKRGIFVRLFPGT